MTGYGGFTASDNTSWCEWCSSPAMGNYVYHYGGACPRVEEVEYYPSGMVKRVKFRVELQHYVWDSRELYPTTTFVGCGGWRRSGADETVGLVS